MVIRPNSNILACHVRSCTSNNFPLQLSNIEIEVREAEYNPDFLRGFWPKIEWPALVATARALGDTSLPETTPDPSSPPSEEVLRALHHVLMEIHIEEGSMICPNCSHSYPISNGIPNMLLAEHEIGAN
ncbi:Uncharacterized conserved protein [Phaffia rhodozyma]|uniref:Uncharacterized conserved protein n=1 Tax=Phaffia rhodozyma TaxID=264483 RepID=A0A0F7SLD3_PHARH|nr:Uncharacterized conserved protein [Phaffia rhodozyma]